VSLETDDITTPELEAGLSSEVETEAKDMARVTEDLQPEASEEVRTSDEDTECEAAGVSRADTTVDTTETTVQATAVGKMADMRPGKMVDIHNGRTGLEVADLEDEEVEDRDMLEL